MKGSLFSCCFVFLALTCHAQDINLVKYKSEIFNTVRIHKNISYAQTVHLGIKDRYYLLDIDEPEQDTTTKRPLIIWLHGGGFRFGSKKAKGIQLWSETFAKRGYVCAPLNYRLSKKNPLFNFTELKRACYDAVQDVAEAVTFFKKNHVLYRIDTNRIILAGNSAGAMIALQSVYSSQAELAALAQLPSSDQLPKIHNPSGIAAVINFWGGLFKIEWLQNARVPVFSAYGNNDKIVPPAYKDTSLYGSIPIHENADRLHIPNAIKEYKGYSHELQKHFNPVFAPSHKTKERWMDAGQAAANFLYTNLFQ